MKHIALSLVALLAMMAAGAAPVAAQNIPIATILRWRSSRSPTW